MYNNLRLLDVLTRHQCYVEGVKAFQQKQFDTVLKQLDETLVDLFKNIRVKTLDELSRYALRNLISALRRSQFSIYSAYTTKVIDDLKAFMAADLLVSKVLFATLERPAGYDETPVSEADATGDLLDAVDSEQGENRLLPFTFLTGSEDGNAKLWSNITNQPIPANGLYLLDFINGFTASASNSIENAIRKGWAMSSTPDEVLNELRGTESNNYRDGQLNRIYTQSGAMNSTAIQFVSAVTQSAVASAYHNRYILSAIIDSKTTSYCRSINGRIYDYGKGPLPPFHINCRTKDIPITDEDEQNVELVGGRWFSWLSRQSKEFREDWLKMEREKGSKEFSGSKPLSIPDFAAKTNLMLIR